MGADLLATILYQRLDLLDYAESLLDKIKISGDDPEAERELVHIVNRLRNLRGRIESVIPVVKDKDAETLISYYIHISNPKEIEILTCIKNLKIGSERFRSEIENDIEKLMALQNKLG